MSRPTPSIKLMPGGLRSATPCLQITCSNELLSRLSTSRCVAFGLLWLLIPRGFAAGQDPVRFAEDVRPILASKCWTCHGPDAEAREADLRLDIRDAALRVLISDDGTEGDLLKRITAADPDERMPPVSTKKPLTAREIDVLRRWISQGAAYQEHWAWSAPVRPALPESGASENPVDHFVNQRLLAEGLAPLPRASRETLIRRASLDLVGIPPTTTEIDAFLADDSEDAWSALIDRLLKSPRYGEHMARPWLDAARYADTDGYQNDRYRYMHVWRDWVILALNDNKPYDDFLVEQLAGDMLPDATLMQQIATGFCRNHRINSEDGSIPAEWHVENVVDRVDTLGTAILGLTVGCARCHDHKYDPISAREYYQLFAYFNNVPEWGVGPNNGNSPPFVEVPKSWPNLSPKENVARIPEPVKLRRARKDKGNGLQRPQAGSHRTVMVMHEMDTPRQTWVLTRGQFNLPDKSQPVSPAVPSALNRHNGSVPRERLELAQWLVDPRHPLTARVAVNRIWQQLFGTGLVRTAENFGMQGELPSHPQLLDWLAVEFIESGWNVKALQKLILTSDTYCRSSQATPELTTRDPDNRLLARGARYRVHPFVLRDTALAVSGLLVDRIGGPPAKPYMPPKIWRSISNNTYKQDTGAQLYRRSVYTFWRRTIPPPTMVNFNSAEREVCVVRKGRTNTPLQALTLMNNVTFVEASRFLAERMLWHSQDHRQSIAFGFRLLTGRLPNVAEQQLLESAHADFLDQYTGRQDAAAELLAVGEKPRDPRLDLIEHAAMTMTASLIMNLDESITRE